MMRGMLKSRKIFFVRRWTGPEHYWRGEMVSPSFRLVSPSLPTIASLGVVLMTAFFVTWSLNVNSAPHASATTERNRIN